MVAFGGYRVVGIKDKVGVFFYTVERSVEIASHHFDYAMKQVAYKWDRQNCQVWFLNTCIV